MTAIERVYSAGIVILLIACGVLFLDLRAAQRQRDVYEKGLTQSLWATYLHRCPTNKVERYTTASLLTNTPVYQPINKAAAQQALCDAQGHKWTGGCSQLGCLVIHEPGSVRHCEICSEEQYRNPGEWK
jgi:hypothetical protein